VIVVNQLTTQVLPVEGFAATTRVQDNLGLPTTESRRSPVRLQIDLLVAHIEDRTVRDLVYTVFEDLLCLLESLDLIESDLHTVDHARETLVLFQLIHGEARALMEFIRTNALSVAAITETLHETLDGIAFAMSHDLQRVFESELDRPIDEPDIVVIGKLNRSHGVLINCLQQSAITLAMVFDSTLVGAKLFNNSDVRYWESIELCNGLSDLIQLMVCFEEEMDERARESMVRGITKFRTQSMQFLMYADWPEFESFCEKALSSLDDPQKLEPVSHQFRCYLETLLGQVKLRAVLADVFEFSDYLQFADHSPQLGVMIRESSLPAGIGRKLAA
jgi:hypothetical protein